MSVFGNDFAAVDLREELCYHSLTEKANSGCMSEVKRAKKKAPIIVGACRYGSGEVYFYFVVIQNLFKKFGVHWSVFKGIKIFWQCCSISWIAMSQSKISSGNINIRITDPSFNHAKTVWFKSGTNLSIVVVH